MKQEFKLIINSIQFSIIFISLLWLTYLVQTLFSIDSLYQFGIYPRSQKGIWGLFLAPFIHSDIEHLISNSIPLLILLSLLHHFYKTLAYKVFVSTFLFGNILVWLAARESYHIGASGIVYGVASFLFVSGMIRKISALSAISLIVVFLYGGMIWGMFPVEWNYHLSYEGHFFGFFVGGTLAFVFKNKGPQPIPHKWDDEEDNDNIDDDNNDIDINSDSNNENNQNTTRTINYHYTDKGISKN